MERRQQESERQVQALLHKTRRLWEENDMLRIQVSSSGPSHSRQPKRQQMNFKQNKEVSFPVNEKFSPDSQEVRPEEKFPPTSPTLLDESSDSTCISTQRRHDKRSQLSDAMRTWLGPQTLDMKGRQRVAMGQEVCPSPSVAVVMLDWLP